MHAYLTGLGLQVHWIKSNAVHDARDAICGKKTKADAADARLIARLLYRREAVGQEDAVTAGHDQVGVYATLRLLVNNWWKLRQVQARAGNQLTQILDVLFPELAEVFTKSLTSPAALAVLARYPTPAALASAGHEEIYRTVVFEARAPRKAVHVPQLLELAARLVGISAGIDDLVAAETYLVGQLRRLGEKVDSIEERIAATVAIAPESRSSAPPRSQDRSVPPRSWAPWVPQPPRSTPERHYAGTWAGPWKKNSPAAASTANDSRYPGIGAPGARCGCGPSGW